MKFTVGKGSDRRINSLGQITERNGLELRVYRKHTTTEAIICGNSCHLHEQKMLAISYMIQTYAITRRESLKPTRNCTLIFHATLC